MATNTNRPEVPFAGTSFPFLQGGIGTVMPGGLPAMQARNVEALMAATRVMVEGLQQVNSRNAEMLSGAFNRFAEDAQGIARAEQPQDLLRLQAEMTRENLDTTLRNIRELTDLTNKCYFSAFDVLNRRCLEAFSEASEQGETATGEMRLSSNGGSTTRRKAPARKRPRRG